MDGTWRKSSRCADRECVEIGAWRKASRSIPNGQCVEAGHGPGVVGVRDSALGDEGPVLEFPAAVWIRFTAGLKAA